MRPWRLFFLLIVALAGLVLILYSRRTTEGEQEPMKWNEVKLDPRRKPRPHKPELDDTGISHGRDGDVEENKGEDVKEKGEPALQKVVCDPKKWDPKLDQARTFVHSLFFLSFFYLLFILKLLACFTWFRLCFFVDVS
jgi:hypothetical protein